MTGEKQIRNNNNMINNNNNNNDNNNNDNDNNNGSKQMQASGSADDNDLVCWKTFFKIFFWSLKNEKKITYDFLFFFSGICQSEKSRRKVTFWRKIPNLMNQQKEISIRNLNNGDGDPDCSECLVVRIEERSLTSICAALFLVLACH